MDCSLIGNWYLPREIFKLLYIMISCTPAFSLWLLWHLLESCIVCKCAKLKTLLLPHVYHVLISKHDYLQKLVHWPFFTHRITVGCECTKSESSGHWDSLGRAFFKPQQASKLPNHCFRQTGGVDMERFEIGIDIWTDIFPYNGLIHRTRFSNRCSLMWLHWIDKARSPGLPTGLLLATVRTCTTQVHLWHGTRYVWGT